MRNWIKSVTAIIATTLISNTVFSQSRKDSGSYRSDDKSQEIIIRKKGGNTEKMTIVVDGENVTINGKPIDEFKNKDITVLKRDRSLAMAPRNRNFYAPGAPFPPESPDLLPPSNRAMLGVMTDKSNDGVRITDVSKESGAEKAGLKKEDVITKVEDKEVKEPADLVEAIRSHKPGDKVDITYKRDGKVNKTSVTLGESVARAFSYNFDNRDFNFRMPEGFNQGMDNFNFNFDRKPKIGLQIQDVENGKGVLVKDVDEDSPAAKAGFKDGDVITQVNGKDVMGVEDLRNGIREMKEGDTVKLSFKRDGKNQTAEIKIPKRLRTADL